MYDQREKAQRDYEWALSGAREEGIAEGREQARKEREQLGMEKGKLVGKIQLLQELLGDRPSSDTDLKELSSEAIAAQLAVLKQRFRDRQA